MSARNSLKNKKLRREERERKRNTRRRNELVTKVQTSSFISDYLTSKENE